jgi:hypothetical protein
VAVRFYPALFDADVFAAELAEGDEVAAIAEAYAAANDDTFSGIDWEVSNSDSVAMLLDYLSHRLERSGFLGYLLPPEVGQAANRLREHGAEDPDSAHLLAVLEIAEPTGRGLLWWWM